jgi:hypothetical protein
MNEKFIKTLNAFINELLTLFEDRNKILYERLLYDRHLVRNVIDPDKLETVATAVFRRHRSMFADKSMNARHLQSLLQDDIISDPLKLTITILWESCTNENKSTIWNWIQTLEGLTEVSI